LLPYSTRLIAASASKSTWNKHASAIACFRNFEIWAGKKHAFPLFETSICEFIEFALKIKGLKHSTVQSYLSSLLFFHKLRKLDESGFTSFIVKTMLKGAKNLEFYTDLTKPTRKAMSFPLLKILSHEIASKNWDPERKQVIWTAMVTAFFGSFRFGEILSKSENAYNENETLLWRDVIFSKGAVTITVKLPKNRKACAEYIDLFSLPDSRFCPILALRKLRAIHKAKSDSHPVFSYTNGSMLTPTVINNTLTLLLTPHLGEEAALYTGHSFRAALPSALASCPEISSDELIKSWGRWTSSSFKLYTRLKLNQRKYIFDKIVESLKIK
jgi:hypothetical protein